ncbi:hypothetical protein ACRARH_09720 [Phytobacter ursingii]
MSQTDDSLSALYEATSERTLAAWQRAPDCGDIMLQGYYDPHKLALASGIQPPLPTLVASLRQQLAIRVSDDTLADVMPADGLHFTFLPITLPLYTTAEPPDDMSTLLTLWQRWRQHSVRISELRLVALPGQILLAGIPDEKSQQARQQFCDALLASPWRTLLLDRHAHTPLPPPFWHTTLLRYRAHYLPPSLRRFFLANRQQRYSSVEGMLKLAQVNYNWTRVLPIE